MHRSRPKLWLVPALLLMSCSGSSANATSDAKSPDLPAAVEAGSALDASSLDASSQLPACSLPTPVDAGADACLIGRFHLQCTYPAGVAFGDGSTFTSPNGPVRDLCVSDDPTGCPGSHPISGVATCESKCAPDQYAISCGGPPDQGYYQEPPDTCVLATPTPSGVGFWCCPCQ
jgi:hypothetical protein